MRRFISIFLLVAITTACGQLPISGPVSGSPPPPLVATAVSDVQGNARVQAASGVVEFETVSGVSGERTAGIRVSVAVVGSERLLFAEDPTGQHLPVASPLRGSSTVRRLIMPPAAGGVNITTAQGTLDVSVLEPLGPMTEEDLRQRMLNGGSEGVLVVFYNPARPLALTGATLEAYATPWDKVTVLRAPAEPEDAELGMVLLSLDQEAMLNYGHITIDRYLAGRIGQQPVTDLTSDLNYGWAYPVFQIFPAEGDVTLEGEEAFTLIVNWRSRNPDPPPPWNFFVTTDNEERVTIEPNTFSLAPDSPPQEVTITVDRSGLPPGAYDAKVFIQPFSEAFGLIEQTVEKDIAYTVLEAQPTPTLGPQAELTILPDNPREGDLLRITAEGFVPNEAVLIEFVGAERNLRDGLPVADAEGVFSYDLDLSTFPEGSYDLRITGTNSGVSAVTEVTVLEGVADAVVNNPVLNLRTDPGCEFPVLEVLADGDELDIIAVNNDDSWVKVVTQTGIEGWVVSRFLRINVDLENIEWDSTVPFSDDTDQSCA
jgi:hypothetical protein